MDISHIITIAIYVVINEYDRNINTIRIYIYIYTFTYSLIYLFIYFSSTTQPCTDVHEQLLDLTHVLRVLWASQGLSIAAWAVMWGGVLGGVRQARAGLGGLGAGLLLVGVVHPDGTGLGGLGAGLLLVGVVHPDGAGLGGLGAGLLLVGVMHPDGTGLGGRVRLMSRSLVGCDGSGPGSVLRGAPGRGRGALLGVAGSSPVSRASAECHVFQRPGELPDC